MNDTHSQFILEEISPRIQAMRPGDIIDCEGMFNPVAWDIVPASRRRHVFGRPVSRLVREGKVPLEFAGFNSTRHNLYRKL